MHLHLWFASALLSEMLLYGFLCKVLSPVVQDQLCKIMPPVQPVHSALFCLSLSSVFFFLPQVAGFSRISAAHCVSPASSCRGEQQVSLIETALIQPVNGRYTTDTHVTTSKRENDCPRNDQAQSDPNTKKHIHFSTQLLTTLLCYGCIYFCLHHPSAIYLTHLYFMIKLLNTDGCVLFQIIIQCKHCNAQISNF